MLQAYLEVEKPYMRSVHQKDIIIPWTPHSSVEIRSGSKLVFFGHSYDPHPMQRRQLFVNSLYRFAIRGSAVTDSQLALMHPTLQGRRRPPYYTPLVQHARIRRNQTLLKMLGMHRNVDGSCVFQSS
jgi:hypothetical protein